MLTPRTENIANNFLSYAKQQYHESSPLYEHLSMQIANDPAILSLASHARYDESSIPHLFLGAVQFLLLKYAGSPLSKFYPSIEPNPGYYRDAYASFRSFCLDHQAEIVRIISSRRVQTNEVQRAACLLPAFHRVDQKAEGRPISIVEVGASAGLNLLWDKYGYDYGNGITCGDPASPVQIFCNLRGNVSLPLPSTFPRVRSRVGIDLDPIDLWDEDDVLWLRSLIWPEHKKRAELLTKAISLARQHPPKVVEGDAFRVLPSILARQPEESAACVYDSNTLFRFSDEQLEAFRSLMADFSKRRDVAHVSYEWWRGSDWQQLELTWFRNGVMGRREPLGYGHPHGEWLHWAPD